MNVLAIDTTGKIGSVCILKNDQKLFEKVMSEPMNHLKFLAPLIDEAINKRYTSDCSISRSRFFYRNKDRCCNCKSDRAISRDSHSCRAYS